ncbi:hypothetical protein KCP78_19815 [Salmonella enterica subsp. enterica]|nr:hypothetical protein KCP78_19815 [Salmonella enterica subsp. enterica]
MRCFARKTRRYRGCVTRCGVANDTDAHCASVCWPGRAARGGGTCRRRSVGRRGRGKAALRVAVGQHRRA